MAEATKRVVMNKTMEVMQGAFNLSCDKVTLVD